MRYKFSEITINYDSKRVPLSAKQRESRKGQYPYYGAQGIIDYIDDYIFDGKYLLIAEDGENLRSKKQKVAQLATGRYWVNNHAHIVQTNEKCLLEYLYYLFNETDISGYITGSAQPKLSQANLNAIELELPPVQEQAKAVSILSALDEKIELNRKMNENLERQAQVLFKEWFIDNPDAGEWQDVTFSDLIEKTISGDWGKDTPSGKNTEMVYCIRGADIPDVRTGNKGKMPTRYILPKNYTTKQLVSGDIVVEISGGSPTQSTGRAAAVSSALLARYDKGTTLDKGIKM